MGNALFQLFVHLVEDFLSTHFNEFRNRLVDPKNLDEKFEELVAMDVALVDSLLGRIDLNQEIFNEAIFELSLLAKELDEVLNFNLLVLVGEKQLVGFL